MWGVGDEDSTWSPDCQAHTSEKQDFEGTREACEYVLQEQAAKHEQVHGGKNNPVRVTSISILSKLYKHLHDPCSSLHTHLSAGPGSLQADPQGQVQGLG